MLAAAVLVDHVVVGGRGAGRGPGGGEAAGGTHGSLGVRETVQCLLPQVEHVLLEEEEPLPGHLVRGERQHLSTQYTVQRRQRHLVVIRRLHVLAAGRQILGRACVAEHLLAAVLEVLHGAHGALGHRDRAGAGGAGLRGTHAGPGDCQLSRRGPQGKAGRGGASGGPGGHAGGRLRNGQRGQAGPRGTPRRHGPETPASTLGGWPHWGGRRGRPGARG